RTPSLRHPPPPPPLLARSPPLRSALGRSLPLRSLLGRSLVRPSPPLRRIGRPAGRPRRRADLDRADLYGAVGVQAAERDRLASGGQQPPVRHARLQHVPRRVVEARAAQD